MALSMMLYFVTFLRNSIYGKIFELNVLNLAEIAGSLSLVLIIQLARVSCCSIVQRLTGVRKAWAMDMTPDGRTQLYRATDCATFFSSMYSYMYIDITTD